MDVARLHAGEFLFDLDVDLTLRPRDLRLACQPGFQFLHGGSASGLLVLDPFALRRLQVFERRFLSGGRFGYLRSSGELRTPRVLPYLDGALELVLLGTIERVLELHVDLAFFAGRLRLLRNPLSDLRGGTTETLTLRRARLLALEFCFRFGCLFWRRDSF